ncbi:MAG: hypothetical protein SU899_05350, partial [Chloroflexota bacterium]|nr:hypothetical protein [Chloroflexota bacterium]
MLTATRSRKISFILAGLAVALIIGALVVGISDNLPGLVLCFIAAILIFIACIHTWRDMKKFL